MTLRSIAIIAETELVAMHSVELMMSRIRISSQDGAVAQVQLPAPAGHPCGQKRRVAGAEGPGLAAAGRLTPTTWAPRRKHVQRQPIAR